MGTMHRLARTSKAVPVQFRNCTVALSTAPPTGPPGSKPRGRKVIRAPRKKLRERAVPSGQFQRTVDFAQIGIGLAVGAVGEVASRALGGGNKGSPVALSPSNAQYLAESLRRMRGAALKLGQMLSISDQSILPDEVRAALDSVRDGADAMPASQLNQVLTSELGVNWREQLAEFDQQPIAAASIGQVHLGQLHDGTAVAVKVQYPGVGESIRSDLRSLEQLATMTGILPDKLYAANIVRVASEELADECRYTREAEYQTRFRELTDRKDGFRVPELSSDKVLTSEWIYGEPLGIVCKQPTPGVWSSSLETRNSVAERLMRLTLKELFVWRIMQTDPNWSNFLFDTETEEIGLIDFGAVKQFDKRFCDLYVKLMHSCIETDRDAILGYSKKLGFLTGEEVPEMNEAHLAAAYSIGAPFAHKGLYDFRETAMTRTVQSDAQVMLKYRLTPPPDEAYSLHRKLAGLFMLCIELGAVIDAQSIFYDELDKYTFGDIE